MAGDTVIRAEALTKRYGANLAVDHVDFEVAAGEIVGILGPNGSGKTTTILMLLGLTEPTSGRAMVAGFDPLRDPLEVKRRVGYLPDQIGFYEGMSARDVELSATAPEGWKTTFDPKTVPSLAASATQNVKLTISPSARAIAGDYQMTVRASATGGVSESANFRITVLTSTLWGAIGIAIIAVALLVVVFSVARFGRR